MLLPATGPPLLSTHKRRSYKVVKENLTLAAEDLLLLNLMLLVMGAFGEFKRILNRKRHQREGHGPCQAAWVLSGPQENCYRLSRRPRLRQRS